MDVPGIAPDKITVELTEKSLIIRGHSVDDKKSTCNCGDGCSCAVCECATHLRRERTVGDVSRTIPIPDGANTHEAHTSLAHGVLTVVFPKMSPSKSRARKLVIRQGDLEQGESKHAKTEGSQGGGSGRQKGRSN